MIFEEIKRLQRRNVNNVLRGTETETLGAQIWNLVPANLECSKSLNKFKKNFKNGLFLLLLLLLSLSIYFMLTRRKNFTIKIFT